MNVGSVAACTTRQQQTTQFLRKFGPAVGILYFLSSLQRWSKERSVRNAMMQKAQRKRRERDDIRAQCVKVGLGWQGLLSWAKKNVQDGSPTPLEVLNMSAKDILARYSAGTLTSAYVTRCFVARAIDVGEALSVNAEENFEDAIRDAEACDRERANGILRGPLHGLPISVKDQVDQKGFDSTCGMAARCFKPLPEDGLLLSLIRDQGAIPFVRTNVPQLLLIPESPNAIWGEALNPHELTRSVGGSTGGEGGLIAARGSPLGIGTDVGGSVRIPAAMCGISALKPTVGRLSSYGLAVPRVNHKNGQTAIRNTAGPMGRSTDDLALLMAGWCRDAMYEADKIIPKLPWDMARYDAVKKNQKLRVGYFLTDGFFDPAPASRRAVIETIEKLREAGHEVIEFAPEELKEAALLYVSIMSADGNMFSLKEALEGEALHPYYGFSNTVSSLPSSVRNIMKFVAGDVLGQSRTAGLLEAARGKSAREFWAAVGQRDHLKKRFLQRFQNAKLDALLCPAMALPALPLGDSQHLTMNISYCFAWNNFDLPAGVLPVTRVQPDEQTYASRYSDKFTTYAAKSLIGSAGLPCCVQVVAMPWEEEKCLGVMNIVEQLSKYDDAIPKHPALRSML